MVLSKIGTVAAAFMIMAFFLECIEYALDKKKKIIKNEGRVRVLRICEHRVGKKSVINTNKKYRFWYAVKNTAMENKKIPFDIDENGFIMPAGERGRHKNPKAIFVFLGDSTTECAVVQPENRFPYKVGQLLDKKINTFNAGYSSAFSYYMLGTLLYKVIPLHPTIVFWCSNIHEIIQVLKYGNLYTGDIFSDRGIMYMEEELQGNLKKRIKHAIRLLIPNIYTLIYSWRKSSKKQVSDVSQREMKYEKADWNLISNLVTSNLNLFIDICRSHGIIPVLMTQSGMFGVKDSSSRLIEIYDKTIKENAKQDYDTFTMLFNKGNELIKKVALDKNVTCIDLAGVIPKEERYIYDLVHYTDAGAVLVAEEICKAICKVGY